MPSVMYVFSVGSVCAVMPNAVVLKIEPRTVGLSVKSPPRNPEEFLLYRKSSPTPSFPIFSLNCPFSTSCSIQILFSLVSCPPPWSSNISSEVKTTSPCMSAIFPKSNVPFSARYDLWLLFVVSLK